MASDEDRSASPDRCPDRVESKRSGLSPMSSGMWWDEFCRLAYERRFIVVTSHESNNFIISPGLTDYEHQMLKNTLLPKYSHMKVIFSKINPFIYSSYTVKDFLDDIIRHYWPELRNG